MGNNPSSSKAFSGSHSSQSQSPAGTPLPHSQNSNVPTRREPKRRGSLQTLATGKATPAPPSASLETAVRGSHSTSASQTRQTPTKRAVATPQLRPLDSIDKTDMGSEQSSQKARPSPATRPVEIPPPSSADALRPFSPSPIDPSAPPPEQYHLPPSQYSRPPRLPLPIDEEFHKPGSPITSAADDAFETDAVDIPDLDGPLPRRSSVLSATTLDEDEADESDVADDQLGTTVPTVIEWKGPGSSVFVSGTFAGVGGWSRKLRLHKNGGSTDPNVFSRTIAIRPGTHYLKFIIDGDMIVSPDMPTTVDFTNALVNYLEVSPTSIPSTPQASEPVEIPQPKLERRVPEGVFPPQILPPSPEEKPAQASSSAAPDSSLSPDTARRPQPQQQPSDDKGLPPVPDSPPKHYHPVIPPFLRDLDNPEDSPIFARATTSQSTLPQPPTLPLFLAKSILNGTTPMKDDSSVLLMPNHTVLNHLATSSIRGGVLGVSGTTRYKRKFLTTIMYKPTSDTSD
ncbi:hypothetical protein B0A49_07025 [Cryomyces minteri]|uniref:Association with the SNF1 complex (ASC) domain-containing protein n=1 Tax=Cryomyces minteri TaxID=331657 RepID=A0A4V5NF20_9PEZI|nr:hypothetical protein B0A49_07025 [Cryomyces minteri]